MSHTRPISLTLLSGLYDDNSPLSLLRGCPHIMARIWKEIQQYWDTVLTLPGDHIDCYEDENQIAVLVDKERDKVQPFFMAPISIDPFSEEIPPSFPQPDLSAPININMMPFIVGNNFKECKLPDYLEPYWGLIDRCLGPERTRSWHHMWPWRKVKSEIGKIFYLTVQESFVEKGHSQRRPGLHVDCPGSVKFKNDECQGSLSKGCGYTQPYRGHNWGRGCGHYIGTPGSINRDNSTFDDWEDEMIDIHSKTAVMQGGIYLASSLPSTCRVWNCSVDRAAIGRLGDVEHLREGLEGPGMEMEPGQIYWITDRTPHESVPVAEGAYRQFFRIVTSQVSLWYTDHSTPNPLGVTPDPAITKIVKGDKFSDEGVQIVEMPGGSTTKVDELLDNESDSDEDE